MRIIKEKHFALDQNTVVTFGKFDGVHKGHRSLLQKTFELAEKEALKVVVFTFQMSDDMQFERRVKEHITTLEERRRLFEDMGVDVLVEYPLDRETAAMEPLEFIEKIIRNSLSAQYVVVGEDWRFGKQRAGDVKTLISASDLYDFEAVILDKEKYQEREISSSWIRDEIRLGNMENAYLLLGYPYTLMGKVLHGNKIGRQLGFPTINMEPEEGKILPPLGVYATKVKYNGKEYFGTTSVGMRPTVTEDKKVTVETFLFDFEGEIYEEFLQVDFYHFERLEVKFDSVEALKKQMAYDVEFTKSYFMI